MGGAFSSSGEKIAGGSGEFVTIQYINFFNAVMEFGERRGAEDYPDIIFNDPFTGESTVIRDQKQFGPSEYTLTLRNNHTIEQMRESLTQFWKLVSQSFRRTLNITRYWEDQVIRKGGITIDFNIYKSSEFTQKILDALTLEIIEMIPAVFWFRLIFPVETDNTDVRDNIEAFKNAVGVRFLEVAKLKAGSTDFHGLDWKVFISHGFLYVNQISKNPKNWHEEGPSDLFKYAYGPTKYTKIYPIRIDENSIESK